MGGRARAGRKVKEFLLLTSICSQNQHTLLKTYVQMKATPFQSESTVKAEQHCLTEVHNKTVPLPSPPPLVATRGGGEGRESGGGSKEERKEGGREQGGRERGREGGEREIGKGEREGEERKRRKRIRNV